MDPLLAEMKETGAATLPQEPTPTPVAATPTPAPATPATPAPTPAPDPVPAASAPAPAAEPTPAEPATPAVPATDVSVDYAKYLQEKSGGRIASEDDLAKIIQERDQLEEQLKKSPELDDYTLKLAAWRQKGYDVDKFHLIHDLPIDELSSEDKVKASLKLQNPHWMEADLDLYLKQKYGILTPEEDGYDEAKARYGKMQLDVDAKSADQELRSLQELTAYSEEDEQAVFQAETERKQAWAVGLPKIATDFGKVTIALGEKGEHSFDYVPTDAQKLKVVQALQKAIQNAPVAYDEAGIKAVNDLFRKEFRDQNFNEIVRAAAAKMASIQKEANIQRVHNPSALADPTPAVPAEKPLEQESMEKLDTFMSGPGRR